MKLRNCTCFVESNKSHYTNMTYLIIIESILLIFNIFLLITFSVGLFGLSKVGSKSGGAVDINYYSLGGFILYFIIYAYFVYCVYKLQENVKKDCECTQDWVRYLLYIQAIFILIGLVINTTYYVRLFL